MRLDLPPGDLSVIMRVLGDVVCPRTFYLHGWMLLVLVALIVRMPVVAWLGRRAD